MIGAAWKLIAMAKIQILFLYEITRSKKSHNT